LFWDSAMIRMAFQLSPIRSLPEFSDFKVSSVNLRVHGHSYGANTLSRLHLFQRRGREVARAAGRVSSLTSGVRPVRCALKLEIIKFEIELWQ
jgi:hypothetical protein